MNQMHTLNEDDGVDWSVRCDVVHHLLERAAHHLAQPNPMPVDTSSELEEVSDWWMTEVIKTNSADRNISLNDLLFVTRASLPCMMNPRLLKE